MNTEALTGQQVAEAGLEGWAFLLYYGLFGLQTRIHTKNFATGLQVAGAIGKAALEMNHQADLDLRASRVDVRLTSGYDVGGVTERDMRLARRISDIAAAAGAELECRSLSRIELALDTPDHQKIAPFWAAVLDGKHVTGGRPRDGSGSRRGILNGRSGPPLQLRSEPRLCGPRGPGRQ